jgi:hypothetical protein
MTDTIDRPLSADVAAMVEAIEKNRVEKELEPEANQKPRQNSEDDPGTTEIAEGSAFAPESIGAVQVILLSRIYDVLLLLLKNQNPADAKMIEAMHTAGIPLGPDPSWAGGSDV